MTVIQRYNDVTKSPEDKRLYRGLQLANGLKVLLVSDATSDKAAVALDVNVGSMSDPRDLPGLAHFLEHMLFMGTEKYPDENEYQKFLDQHGGSSNAFTSSEHTNYYFDVSPAHLEGATDRFAQFFLAPLFTESATDREVLAVNSEHEKNVASDSWRFEQLQRALGDPDHDFSKFGTGNADTLDIKPRSCGVNVRKALLDFHDTWYSANIMCLTIVGTQSLDDLEGLAVRLFAGIKNKNVVAPSWPIHPYDPLKSSPKMTKVVPIRDVRQLHMVFPIGDQRDLYRTGPARYLSHLVGHESEGSILSALKALGFAIRLSAGYKRGARGFAFFVINTELTEEGLEHVDDVITIVFEYLDNIRGNGVCTWIFDECRDVNSMLFRFKDKERPHSYASSVALRLHTYPFNEVLTGPWITDKWDPKAIYMVLDNLVPTCVYVSIVAKKFYGEAAKTEPWYGTRYTTDSVSDEVLASWSGVVEPGKERVHLPKPNNLIPTNFDLATRDLQSETLVPSIIKQTKLARLWYMQDTEFFLPKACFSAELRTPLANVDPHHANLSNMVAIVLTDAMTEFAYMAELAGLSAVVSATKYGFNLCMNGYNEKQPVLLKRLMDMLVDLHVDEGRFEALREAYIRGLRNARTNQPHQHAVYQNNAMLANHMWTRDEMLEAADESLNSAAVAEYSRRCFDRVHVEALAYGNFTVASATELMDIMAEKLTASKPLISSQLIKHREVCLEAGSPRYHVTHNDVHTSSCIEFYLQTGIQETKANAVLEMLAQILYEPCFDVLRTKEQLGYIVFSGVRRSCGVQGLRIIVQSARKPAYLESRIEAFLASMRTTIREMSEDEFERHRQALIDKRSEKPKSMAGRNNKLWTEITEQQYNFERDVVEVDFLRHISRDDVTNFFDEAIAAESKSRRKMCAFITSTIAKDDNADGDKKVNDDDVDPLGELITDKTSFKTSRPLHSLASPFKALQSFVRSQP